MPDSSDEEHPFVQYGTALPEIDESTVKPSNLKSSVPVFDQIVTDEQGRRRFHGAFTGGFSAGYYNTVGTQEGWVPTSFKSSRSNKTGRKNFIAQDFMDEEDMGHFGIAPKTLSTKEDFTSSRKRTAIEEKQMKFQEEKLTLSLGSDLVESLVVPVRSNIGLKILRGMGWKDGQGLGPHVVRKKKKKKKVEKAANDAKVYGCRLPGAGGSESDDDFIPDNFQFAPKDQMPVTLIQKDDHHGIGYSGLDPTAALHKKVKKSTAVKAKTKAGSKLSFYGQAFGVGAYEEEDEDIYAQDSLTNYDAIMGEEKNPDNTFGWTKPLAITGGPEYEAIGDGSVVKIVFVAAKRQTKLYPKVYPPPNIPQGYDPFRRLKLKTGKQRIDNMNLPQTGSHVPLVTSSTPQIHLTSDDRHAMLDEATAKSPQQTQSVFDFISWEDRQRLEAAKRKPVEDEVKVKTELVDEPQADGSTPLCKPSTLKPFADNAEKLKRYEEYERAVRERRKDPYSTISSSLTEWEKKHERDEFGKLSQVYLHLTSNINSRFTKASEDEGVKGQEGLQAASGETKLKVFGVTTHSTTEWHPDSLLCKRFNVPNPYPDSNLVGSQLPSGSKYLSNLALALSGEERSIYEGQKKSDVAKNETGIVSDTVRPPLFEKARPFIGGRWDKQPDFVGPHSKPPETENKENDPDNASDDEKAESPSERPSMDLFKSIFASSEDESESDDSDDAESEHDVPPVPPSSINEKISAAEVLLKPLPFRSETKETSPDEIMTLDDKERTSNINNVEVPEPTRNGDVSDDEDDMFGPAPPPPSTHYRPPSVPSVDSNESEFQSHKRHSKHKKHKKREHKSKKKKKHKSSA